ncbi:membrane protein [Piscirickettsia salmonis]|uniref:Uncharacterized protein n=1 Tax=Piscirickettsia salmonis TaxID=1238 RepID=A0A9Q6LLL5_PISSA|nr:membrane protein [Piscirickettsia salmonis]ALA24976.1 membrane protein [Piscirickettsia salmonis]ERL62754.1 putative membrane protein [Piscirickettsia salmonis LF-89 = ATCC VR-1361]QGN77361.1 hypothetical protein Psal001_01572 [Piscirickettsia salmonis]QGN80946.1 hypothetical protein Psal002_01592 [Piscirickettsia salmonis]QGN84778.1 hypothetical protein Psal003_01836 [Piscirickettsia salmonis]
MGTFWLGGALLLAVWYGLSYLVFNWWGVISAMVVTLFFTVLFHYFHTAEKKIGDKKG